MALSDKTEYCRFMDYMDVVDEQLDVCLDAMESIYNHANDGHEHFHSICSMSLEYAKLQCTRGNPYGALLLLEHFLMPSM